MNRIALIAILAAGCLTGCSSNPTNAPTVEEAKAADASRAAAIDNNPNLTPQQKAAIKSHMNGGKGL